MRSAGTIFIPGYMWQHLLALIFPPRETQSILFNYDKLPAANETRNFLGCEVTYICTYTKPAVHAAIVESKYYQNKRAHKLLGTILKEYLATTQKFDVIIPIPLSAERRKVRGHNQVISILRAAKLSYTEALTRVHAESQTNLSRQARIENVKNAFAVSSNSIEGRHILLVDDVVTTGATLTAAAKALAAAGPATITLLALAH